jgi:hypothetical protein
MIYFDPLRARIPFPLMQEYCTQKGLPSARGWDLLRVKLDEESDGNTARAAEIAVSLEEIFKEAITLGARAVKVFQVKEELRSSYLDALVAVCPEESDYLESYPRPLSAEQLAAVTSDLKVCAVKPADDGRSVHIVLCGRRMVEIKEPRTRADIGTDAINEFGWEQYDEFILIRRRFVQSYEVVRFDVSTGILELRAEDHSGTDTVLALQALQDKSNELLVRALGNQVHLALCQNLFPAIRAIYDTPNEGIVVELGFTTATGSAKHEKMRANRADLRTELFHVGGKNAINGALTPFRIAVRWLAGAQRGQSLQEEVLLPGSIRQLGGGMPFLDHMVLSGALSEPMMQALVARVLAHLPP